MKAATILPSARFDRVVPFRMERVACDVEAGHLGVADLHILFVAARVERALDLEPGVGGGGADELGHGEAVCQRATPPVLRDAPEQTIRSRLQTYDDILDACQGVWRFLINDPDRIRSIGTREWAWVNL